MRQKVTSYPVMPEAYPKEAAPFVYTKRAEEFAAARPHLEKRTAGTIACFAGEVLREGPTARAWLKCGYVVAR